MYKRFGSLIKNHWFIDNVMTPMKPFIIIIIIMLSKVSKVGQSHFRQAIKREIKFRRCLSLKQLEPVSQIWFLTDHKMNHQDHYSLNIKENMQHKCSIRKLPPPPPWFFFVENSFVLEPRAFPKSDDAMALRKVFHKLSQRYCLGFNFWLQYLLIYALCNLNTILAILQF